MRSMKKFPSPRLIKAYADTRYQVDLSPKPAVLKVGEANEPIDRLLTFNKVSTAAFLTAWNPESTPLSAEENAARHARLQHKVREAGYKSISGRGIGDDPSWVPEESLLILGIAEFEACQLAREFEQFGLIWHRQGLPTELLIVVAA